MKRPLVAIVGRMNVGKSTLFNCLTHTRHAIVSSWEGTTRDVNLGRVLWRGEECDVFDTGGLDVVGDEQLDERIVEAAHRAMTEADVILFVVDGLTGVLPQDNELARELRKTKKPLITVVNKVDSEHKERQVGSEVWKLRLGPVFFISASNGRGTGDLLDAVFDLFEQTVDASVVDRRTAVAIVGRPNVGKSSLLNAILGETRVIVADAAHTTRTTNDIPFAYRGRPYMLIDTAGIRKQAKVGTLGTDKRLGEIERASVSQAIGAMERADVVVLVLEAQKRVATQDKKIASLADRHGKGVVLVVNKWDLVEDKDASTINKFRKYFDANLPVIRWAPIIFVSAAEALRVREMLDLVDQVSLNYARQLTAADIDAVFRRAMKEYHPKQNGTRKYKKVNAGFKSLEQIGIQPPRFALMCRHPKDVPPAIVSIIERELRERFDFEGVKIIIEVRSS